MGGFGGGSSNYSSQSQSFTGLRGTGYQGNAEAQANQQGMLMSDLSNRMFSSPGAMMNFGRQMVPQGQYGLGENADQAVQALGKYQFGLSSGDLAARGQLSPENQSSVVGSSIQNMLPFLIPQIQQFQQAQFMAPQSLMNMAQTSANYWNTALGAQSTSSASGNAFNFNANVASPPAPGKP